MAISDSLDAADDRVCAGGSNGSNYDAEEKGQMLVENSQRPERHRGKCKSQCQYGEHE